MKSLWDAGQLAIVHGVGYPNPDLSHFTSMAIWMNGRFGVGAAEHRLDRSLARRATGGDADLMAATIGSSVPLHLLGAVRRAVAVPANGGEHVRHRDRSGRRCGCSTASGRCRRALPDVVPGTTCSPAC